MVLSNVNTRSDAIAEIKTGKVSGLTEWQRANLSSFQHNHSLVAKRLLPLEFVADPDPRVQLEDRSASMHVFHHFALVPGLPHPVSDCQELCSHPELLIQLRRGVLPVSV